MKEDIEIKGFRCDICIDEIKIDFGQSIQQKYIQL